VRLFVRRALIVSLLAAVAVVCWALSNTLLYTIEFQAREVRDFYGWIP
jgi:hypothetical protein